MKGIILAAGKGTRLYPACKVINKQLIPIYDKPMIYYPLTVLIDAGISEILIVSSEKDLSSFQMLLGDGSQLGIHIEYTVQYIQRGIADAFLIGERFIGNDSVCLMLGDNLFYSADFIDKISGCCSLTEGAMVFGLPSDNPSQFGVVEFDECGNVLSIEEKPVKPKSNYIIPGLYFYDNHVVEAAKSIKPSARGELEITDVNKVYLDQKQLKVALFNEDTVWFDAGTPERILQASLKIKELQDENHTMIGSVEEAAYKQGFITHDQMLMLAQSIGQTDYGKYLLEIKKD